MASTSTQTFGNSLASVDDIRDKSFAGPGATDTSLATYDNTQPNIPHTDSSSDELSREAMKEDAPANGGGGAPPTGGKDGAGQIQRSKGKIALIMFALGMAVFLAALDVTIITTALPSISEHFHSASGYTWVGSAYLLGNASSTPIWGKLSDIYGRKPVLLVANFGFFVGSLIAGLSVNIGMLIAARAIQGISGGGLVVLVNITIGDLFSPRDRGAYYGIIGGVWAVASSLGPIVGGLFAEKVTWRWCFYLNLPLDGAAFIIILLFLDLKTPTTPFMAGIKAIDWIGAFFIIGGTLMLLFGLEDGGQEYPWSSATILCLLIFGGVSFVIFGLVEWKFAKYPIVPLRIFKFRSNLAALGLCFCHGFVFIGGSYYLPLYFQTVLNATPILSGVYVLPTSVALSIGSIATGIFIKKTGKYLPPIYFGLFMMTLGQGLFINFPAHPAWAKLILYQGILGLGIGPLFQAPLIALQSKINPRDIGTATATFGFTRNLGTSISVVVGQVVLQNEVAKRQGQLVAALGPQLAAVIGGGNAGANAKTISALPVAQRDVVHNVLTESLKYVWIVYTVFSALGLVLGFLITKQTLNKQHEETKTGLAAEEENRKRVIAEKEAGKKAKDIELADSK